MDGRRPQITGGWDQINEDILYGQALKEALADGPLWAEGNIRIGDYILLLDSDTRVPVDCLIDGASEMEQCPEVGILQHCNGTFLAGAGGSSPSIVSICCDHLACCIRLFRELYRILHSDSEFQHIVGSQPWQFSAFHGPWRLSALDSPSTTELC